VGTVVLHFRPGPLGFWPTWVFWVYSVFEATLDIEHRILFPQVEILAGAAAALFGFGRHGILTMSTFTAGGFGFLAMVVYRLRGRKAPIYLPYAPFLLLGGWLLLLMSGWN